MKREQKTTSAHPQKLEARKETHPKFKGSVWGRCGPHRRNWNFFNRRKVNRSKSLTTPHPKSLSKNLTFGRTYLCLLIEEKLTEWKSWKANKEVIWFDPLSLGGIRSRSFQTDENASVFPMKEPSPGPGHLMILNLNTIPCHPSSPTCPQQMKKRIPRSFSPV